jgi:prepilin-type N-terminal cleavage/methylation domain-containing protein
MDRRAGNAGFTLVEVMMAMLILTFGVTSLLGLMTLGVSTRRSAEQLNRAVYLVDEALQRVQEEVFAARPEAGADAPAADAGPAPLAPVRVDRVPGVPGMSYSIEFVADASDPDVVLARIDVRWREQGEVMAEIFHRLLRRQEPFARRVSRIVRNPR